MKVRENSLSLSLSLLTIESQGRPRAIEASDRTADQWAIFYLFFFLGSSLRFGVRSATEWVVGRGGGFMFDYLWKPTVKFPLVFSFVRYGGVLLLCVVVTATYFVCIFCSPRRPGLLLSVLFSFLSHVFFLRPQTGGRFVTLGLSVMTWATLSLSSSFIPQFVTSQCTPAPLVSFLFIIIHLLLPSLSLPTFKGSSSSSSFRLRPTVVWYRVVVGSSIRKTVKAFSFRKLGRKENERRGMPFNCLVPAVTFRIPSGFSSFLFEILPPVFWDPDCSLSTQLR